MRAVGVEMIEMGGNGWKWVEMVEMVNVENDRNGWKCVENVLKMVKMVISEEKNKHRRRPRSG